MYKKYPTIDEVNQASRLEICAWYRFLPSPKSKEEIQIIDRVCIRFSELGGFTPEISKAIGCYDKL